jgi:hypothetical protein
MGSKMAYLPANPDRCAINSCVHTWLVCGWSREEPHKSASWHWVDDLRVDSNASDRWVVDTQAGEEEDSEEVACQVGAASVAGKGDCVVGLCAGCVGTDGLWEPEVHVYTVCAVDDIFAGAVFYPVL